jgi:hypothetical protein
MILARLWIVRHEFTISEFGAFDRGIYVIHSYDILGAGMLSKPKDLHKIR